MNPRQILVGVLLLQWAWLVPANAQAIPGQDQAPTVTIERLQRENSRLRAALSACGERRDAAPAAATAAEATVAAPPVKTPATPAAARSAVAVHGARPQVAAAAATASGESSSAAPAGLRNNPPSPASRTYSKSTGDDPKADQVQSPIPFPQVPSNTDWLDAHLQNQYAILKRLYTPGALQSLTQQEQGCGDPRTGMYCRIKLGLHWIGSAVRQ